LFRPQRAWTHLVSLDGPHYHAQLPELKMASPQTASPLPAGRPVLWRLRLLMALVVALVAAATYPAGSGVLLLVPFGLPFAFALVLLPRRGVVAWACGLSALLLCVFFFYGITLAGLGDGWLRLASIPLVAMAVVSFLAVRDAAHIWNSSQTPAARGALAVRSALAFIYAGLTVVVAAVELPDLITNRPAINESNAVATLRSQSTALAAFAQEHPQQPLPATLDELGDALPPNHRCGKPMCENHGYRFAYTRLDGNAGGGSYDLIARPLEFRRTGRRSFFADQTGTIRATSEDRDPTATDPPLN
jgi:hypothetical protein